MLQLELLSDEDIFHLNPARPLNRPEIDEIRDGAAPSITCMSLPSAAQPE